MPGTGAIQASPQNIASPTRVRKSTFVNIEDQNPLHPDAFMKNNLANTQPPAAVIDKLMTTSPAKSL